MIITLKFILAIILGAAVSSEISYQSIPDYASGRGHLLKIRSHYLKVGLPLFIMISTILYHLPISIKFLSSLNLEQERILGASFLTLILTCSLLYYFYKQFLQFDKDVIFQNNLGLLQVNGRVNGLDLRIRELNKSFNESSVSLVKDNHYLLSRLGDLRKDLQSTSSEVVTLKDNFSELKDLGNDVGSTFSEVVTLKDNLKDNFSELSDLRKDLEKTRKDLESTSSELTQLRENFNDLLMQVGSGKKTPKGQR